MYHIFYVITNYYPFKKLIYFIGYKGHEHRVKMISICRNRQICGKINYT